MRHAWLPIALAALFGLRGPFCTYACLESAAAGPAPSAAMACHGEAGEPAIPSSPACDCCCSEMVAAAEGKFSHAAIDPPARSAFFATSDVARAAPDLPGPVLRAPPSDLPLLNSALLL